jgi:hypothetical protein
MCGGVLSSRLAEKEKQVSDLQAELAKLRESLELHRNKNNVGVLCCRLSSCFPSPHPHYLPLQSSPDIHLQTSSCIYSAKPGVLKPFLGDPPVILFI